MPCLLLSTEYFNPFGREQLRFGMEPSFKEYMIFDGT